MAAPTNITDAVAAATSSTPPSVATVFSGINNLALTIVYYIFSFALGLAIHAAGIWICTQLLRSRLQTMSTDARSALLSLAMSCALFTNVGSPIVVEKALHIGAAYWFRILIGNLAAWFTVLYCFALGAMAYYAYIGISAILARTHGQYQPVAAGPSDDELDAVELTRAKDTDAEA